MAYTSGERGLQFFTVRACMARRINESKIKRKIEIIFQFAKLFNLRMYGAEKWLLDLTFEGSQTCAEKVVS